MVYPSDLSNYPLQSWRVPHGPIKTPHSLFARGLWPVRYRPSSAGVPFDQEETLPLVEGSPFALRKRSITDVLVYGRRPLTQTWPLLKEVHASTAVDSQWRQWDLLANFVEKLKISFLLSFQEIYSIRNAILNSLQNKIANSLQKKT